MTQNPEWRKDITCDQCDSPYHTTDFCPFGEMTEDMDVEAVIRRGAAAAERERRPMFEAVALILVDVGDEEPEMTPDEARAYDAYSMARDCPQHGATTLVEAGEAPSMMSGTDPWERLACGCAVTWNPFTGAACFTPAREHTRERTGQEAAPTTVRQDLDPWELDADDGPRVAWDRAETEPCQRGTVGCPIDHTSGSPCDTW